jgi:hypothetical protein
MIMISDALICRDGGALDWNNPKDIYRHVTSSH